MHGSLDITWDVAMMMGCSDVGGRQQRAMMWHPCAGLMCTLMCPQGLASLPCMGTMRHRDTGWKLLPTFQPENGRWPSLQELFLSVCLWSMVLCYGCYSCASRAWASCPQTCQNCACRYTESKSNNLSYWGLDYPPLSAYQV